MRRSGVRTVAMVALVSGLAVTTWGASARAAQRDSTAKTVSGTVSCPIAKQALQLYAFAYRPSLGYADALISTGPAGTPATTELVGARTDKSNYVLSSACSRTKVSVRFTHRRLRSAGVIKAGYYQWPTVYCAAPRRVFVRYRISFDASAKPVTATMTAWARSKKSRLREIGYVQWSRNRSVTFYSPKSCVSQ
jgi:hypothetical protein